MRETSGRRVCAGEEERSSCVQPRLRGQSETLGFILVFAIMIAAVVFILAYGSAAMSGAESELSEDRAEKALTQFDSKAALVALGEAHTQRVGFGNDGGEYFRVNEDAGQMSITVENRSNQEVDEILNLTLGEVVYEQDETRLAYQGGGVWRPDADGESMISPPEFHYRSGTLTLPAISVSGDRELGSEALIAHESESSVYPTPVGVEGENPLEDHQVDVTVQSDYYRGWGQYFEDRTDGSVDYDHANDEVTVTLVSPVDIDEVTAASASLSAGGEFNVTGTSASTCDATGADDVFTDSYDSSEGTYCGQFEAGEPPGKSGDVVYGKDIDISDGTGGSDFYGDIESGQTVTVDDSQGEGQPSVYGNIRFVDRCVTDKENDTESCEDRIMNESDGVVEQIDEVSLTNEIDWFVETAVDDIWENADEVNPDVEGERLTAGEYAFDSLDLDTSLELDTSDGDVFLAVNESVHLGDDAQIEVTGDGHAELFIQGEPGTDDLVLPNNASITNEGDDATKFRLFGTADFDAVLGGGGSGNLATYVGVIYAPPGDTGTGSVTLDGGEVFGGVLTGTTSIEGGSIHYDEALEGNAIVPEEARVIRVTYLHVTENHITVTNG